MNKITEWTLPILFLVTLVLGGLEFWIGVILELTGYHAIRLLVGGYVIVEILLVLFFILAGMKSRRANP